MGEIDIPRSVTVEVCEFCNRCCPWCPRSTRPRGREPALMPMELIGKIASELAAVGYIGRFGLHLFNEPLVDKRLPDIIRLVKSILPQSEPYIHTNGDFMTTETWRSLREAGLYKAHVNKYDERSGERTEELWRSLSDQDKASFLIRRFVSRKHAFSRGGLIETRRQVPMAVRCKRIWQLCVNYKGDVVLCCNDYLGQVVVGNAANANVIDLFNDKRLVHYRKLLAEGRRGDLPLCDKCDL